MSSYTQKLHYADFEVDFGRRLVAKFKFNPRSFWRNGYFPRIERAALYPDEGCPIFAVAQSIKCQLPGR